jgi:hypothetical protein
VFESARLDASRRACPLDDRAPRALRVR